MKELVSDLHVSLGVEDESEEEGKGETKTQSGQDESGSEVHDEDKSD